jgi:hypothetical protein
MADRPVIQRASERALAQGVTMKSVLAMVSAFRRDDASTPLVLMGYANPIEAMGTEKFADRAKDAGVDGVIVIDYPPEEAGEFTAVVTARGIAPIFLLSPTTPAARMDSVGRLARGYVYYVSLKGVVQVIDTAEVVARSADISTSRCQSAWARHCRQCACDCGYADAVVTAWPHRQSKRVHPRKRACVGMARYNTQRHRQAGRVRDSARRTPGRE